MDISKSTYELLLPIIARIKNTVYVNSVIANTGNTFTLTTCNTLWATIGFPVFINNVEYKITDFVDNVSITVKPKTGTIAPVIGGFLLYVPKFYHGTIKATEVDLNKKVNNNLLTSDKLPMIWLHEPIEEIISPNEDEPIERKSNCDLYFLNDANFAQWNNDQHYKYAIKPMRRLFMALYDSMKYSGFINYDLIKNYRIIDLPRFGSYAISSNKSNQTGPASESTIFAQYNMSGTKVGIQIPWLRIDDRCCYSPGETVCFDSTVKNSNNTFTHDIDSGTIYNLPDQSVEIYQDGVLIQTVAYIPLDGVAGSVFSSPNTCANSTVKNSNNSFIQSIVSGGSLTLQDQDFEIYIDGNLAYSVSAPSMSTEIINVP